ncbi:MAG TPA: hypothetical protein VGK10_19540 [Prolixibacteraceae bacterium]
MKKKSLCFVVMLLIIANVFLSPTTVTKKQSQLSLTLLEARADEPVEIDPPGGEYPPTRPFSNDWTLSAIIDYFI